MKKKIDFNKLIIICIISIIYIVPISTISTDSNYNIYYYTRLILVALALILFFKRFKIKVSYCFFIIIFVARLIIYGEISVNIILLMSCLYLFDHLLEIDFKFEKINKIITVCSSIFLIQIIVATIIKGKLQTASFIGDNNYTGYFIFFFYTYYLYTKNKKWVLWMLLALFTFSRATIIAVSVLMLFYLLQGKKEIFSKDSNLKVIKIIFWIGQFIIIPISYIFVDKFNGIDYKYVYVQGFNRLNNLMDSSNYLRFMVNILAFESFNIKNLLIGLQANTFEGLTYVAGKTLFPHNSILALYIHFGIVIALLYMSKYIKVYKKYNTGKIIPIYIAMLIYQCFLGPSSFYGTEILVFMIIIKGINQYLKKEENYQNENRYINITRV